MKQGVKLLNGLSELHIKGLITMIYCSIAACHLQPKLTRFSYLFVFQLLSSILNYLYKCLVSEEVYS